MSLILDALNKADRERQPPPSTPDIQSIHQPYVAPVEIAPWKKGIPYALGGMSLVLFVLVIYLLSNKNSETTPPAIVKATPPSVTATPPPVQPYIDNVPAQQPDTTPPAVSPVTQQPTQAVKPVVKAPEKKAQYKPAVDSLYSREQVTQEVEPEQTTQRAPAKPKEEKRPQLDEQTIQQLMAGESIQSVRDLPWSIQEKIPTIMYAEHNYQTNGNSSVTLNKAVKRKGDQVFPGIYIEEIRPESLVLKYQGEKFKLDALSSWVNM
ncbi:general secretion pathway protein GspB [Teredinibacter sp. KSP-S5-2]|uniref:general secretion pathway protein GspB n=1 Tax=Teredinibacter sp. KSP-S5-2 TaxID=3034506 RepID=UPI0029342B5F|nr:general secretion pathway protein GspB [Teredinibacter sp. KSP-S5-2]WNO09913.1 general secretion pathway protein GspB [Teredinibacter sp. KSP-S5-2]